jgi:diaminopimelate epimerase
MRFSKWHALGNAYLLVERADLRDPLTPALVELLCDPRFGVGSDGLLEVVTAEGAEAEISVWNPDGSTAEFSGNGARIAARWLAKRSGEDGVRLRFGDRVVEARAADARVELDVGPVVVGKPETLDIHGEELEFTPVSVGNQHAVLRLDFDENDVHFYGPVLQDDPRFPAGTNVQLVRVLGRADIVVAVWERGAGATLSSGSSAVAAAAAAVANGWCDPVVTVAFAGAGELEVELDEELNATLAGPVEEIFTGELSDEFLRRSA